jgi:hypothetical protein
MHPFEKGSNKVRKFPSAGKLPLQRKRNPNVGNATNAAVQHKTRASAPNIRYRIV